MQGLGLSLVYVGPGFWEIHPIKAFCVRADCSFSSPEGSSSATRDCGSLREWSKGLRPIPAQVGGSGNVFPLSLSSVRSRFECFSLLKDCVPRYVLCQGKIFLRESSALLPRSPVGVIFMYWMLSVVPKRERATNQEVLRKDAWYGQKATTMSKGMSTTRGTTRGSMSWDVLRRHNLRSPQENASSIGIHVSRACGVKNWCPRSHRKCIEIWWDQGIDLNESAKVLQNWERRLRRDMKEMHCVILPPKWKCVWPCSSVSESARFCMWAMGATRLLDLVHGLPWDAIVI